MRYVLIWCSRMGIFALHMPDMTVKTYGESELRAKFCGYGSLMEWLEFTKEHQDVEVVYNMLPR